MTLILGQESEPAAPSSAKVHVFIGADGRVKAKLPSGAVLDLSLGRAENLLANGGFWLAQRQNVGTFTTYSNTSGRAYGPDRWGFTNENTSVQYARADARSAPETGLAAAYYGKIKKITSAGKIVVSQVIEGVHVTPVRGRRVALQFRAKSIIGTHTLRLALLQLQAAGAVDTIPATFISAFGAAGTDPTWGTNLAAITPALAYGAGSLSGAGVACVLTTAWQRFGGVFSIPSDCKNLVVVIFTDGQPAALDEVGVAEFGLYEGDEEREWVPPCMTHEMNRCLRYYHKTFDLDVGPVQNIGSVSGAFRYITHTALSTTNRSDAFQHPVRMRTVPTVTSYNPMAANAQARNAQTGTDCSALAVQAITDRGFAISVTGPSTGAVGDVIAVHLTFDAEL